MSRMINEDNLMAEISPFLKCGNCLTFYDLNQRAPHVLRCGHTFCKKCIFSKNQNEITTNGDILFKFTCLRCKNITKGI